MGDLKVDNIYRLTHEYTGKQYKVFEAKLTKILHKTTQGGITELVFVVNKQPGEIRFRYPINPKKKYGIIKIEKWVTGYEVAGCIQGYGMDADKFFNVTREYLEAKTIEEAQQLAGQDKVFVERIQSIERWEVI